MRPCSEFLNPKKIRDNNLPHYYFFVTCFAPASFSSRVKGDFIVQVCGDVGLRFQMPRF
jgi:hypothetical protein